MNAAGVRGSAWRWLWLAALVVVLDQGTKHLAGLWLAYREPVEVLPVLNMMLTYNPGAAFSFLSDAGGWQRWFFTAIAAVVSLALVVWLVRMPRDSSPWLAAALALILGGAVGNLWDRVALGAVVDFIDLHWGRHHWPAFNVADSAISIGAVIIVWSTFFGRGDAGDGPEAARSGTGAGRAGAGRKGNDRGTKETRST